MIIDARPIVRAVYSTHRRRRGPDYLHILDEETPHWGRKPMCTANPLGLAVVLDVLPSEPPEASTWCARCVGIVAHKLGMLDRVVAALAGGTARALYGGSLHGKHARYMHVQDEDTRQPGRPLCRPANRIVRPVVVDPLPARPVRGLTWCPTCLGLQAQAHGALDHVVAMVIAQANGDGADA